MNDSTEANVGGAAGGRPRGSTQVSLTLSRLRELAQLVLLNDRRPLASPQIGYLKKALKKVNELVHKQPGSSALAERYLAKVMLGQLVNVVVHARGPRAVQLKELSTQCRELAAMIELNEPERRPLELQLKQLADEWGISLRTAWNYYNSVRNSKTGFRLSSTEEIENERQVSTLFQSANSELRSIAAESIQRVLRVAGDLYPDEAPDVAKLFFELFALGFELLHAGPSLSHDIRCKIEVMVAEIETTAGAAWARRKRAADAV